MSLEKVCVIDKIEVLETNQIQIRRADRIMEDGEEISKKYHRHVISPGDDVSGEDERVIAVVNALWTEEVIANYRASLEPIEQTEEAPVETPE